MRLPVDPGASGGPRTVVHGLNERTANSLPAGILVCEQVLNSTFRIFDGIESST